MKTIPVEIGKGKETAFAVESITPGGEVRRALSVLKVGTTTHPEKFDILSFDNLKRVKGAQGKLPENLLIQRAAYATAQSDNILATMKYK